LTDIYPAGEAPIPGVDLEAVADAVRRASAVPVHLVPVLERVAPVAAALARPGDTVLTLGAGSIGSVARAVVRELEALHRA
jgi:UDP-N-acetylmuramate--alanine ligase